ncbi:MAG TPA: translocation/assembly module TamB domain-containing protein [Bryobacteraceae bacterium]|nr:translocation/assembly module TamB domain-containing protein [Bryobacteraceae bacterium]
MRKLGRILLRILAALALLAAVCALGTVLVFRSGWFHELVHRRLIAEIEKATGGRVEVGNFSFNANRLEVNVSPLVLHGKESAAEPPFVRIASLTARLRIISMVERKIDLSELHIVQPQVRIVFYPDGSTNLPEPAVRPTSLWSEHLVHLAVRRYEVTNGLFEYDGQDIPLNIRGEHLLVRMAYEPSRTNPFYRGEFESNRIRVIPGGAGPVEVDASAAFTLDKSKIDVKRLEISTAESRAVVTGGFTNLRRPRGTFTVKATASAREAVRFFAVPIDPAGSATFDGRLNISFDKPFEFSMKGRAAAKGLGYHQDRVRIENADVRGDLALGLDSITLQDLTLTALGATVNGQATLLHWRDFHAEGNLQGLGLQSAAHVITDRPVPWHATLAGGFSLDASLAKPAARFQGNIGMYPAPQEGSPLEGHLDVDYDQAAGTLAFGQSYLSTPASRVDFSGTLGQTLDMRAQSTNLDDLLPALALYDPNAPRELPLKLNNGRAVFIGSVSGALDDPRVVGKATITNAVATVKTVPHAFDSLAASLDASRRDIHLSAFTLTRGKTSIDGQATIAGNNGSFDDASLDATLNLHDVQLAELMKETGQSFDVTGNGSASAHIAGTMQNPVADIAAQVEKLAVFDEQVDRASATLHYADHNIAVSSGNAQTGPARIRFDGAYSQSSGDTRFSVTAENLPGARIHALSKLPMHADGTVTAKFSGTGRVAGGAFALRTLSGDATARDITLDGDGVGDLSLTAHTQGSDLSVRANATVRGAKFDATGAWKLEGDDPGSLTIHAQRVDIATAHRIYRIGGTNEQKNEVLPFEGFIDSHATVAVSLRKPEEFRAEITLDQAQINARKSQALKLGVQPEDVVLHNVRPVSVILTSKEARLQSAQFSARGTSLEAAGGIPFDPQAPADLAVRGSVNLAILQLYNPDLLARGSATVQASVKGSIRDPQVNGRMELKSASLYLSDLPNGIDNANGSVTFDRNRATIETLTAETGGGKVFFAGFVELRDVLTYRLQAEAQQVRVRYPEDVSNTFSAKLALNGTSDASTLSGSITLIRAAFNPHSDLGGFLALAAKPVPAPATPNEYLRGMQFDVRIESGPNFEFQTSLTRNVEAEIDLHLRGTPLRPVLLGSISINQGEIQIFGNRYTVDRGDIRFLNPIKIEPTFDMDLGTRARGIVVDISFSGTLQKLNVNYSSDPPLQTREIIALLAVGRDPNALGSTAAGQIATGSSTALEAGGGLLSEAVSAQLSSRLQRFFGASRVKIDPTVTGVDTLPQARLTVEQQVSKEITLTYITNLNRTQEQAVQFEWAFSPHWSAIAVRQENGLFGIYFQYRKRFK